MKSYAIAFLILTFYVCLSGQSSLPIPFRENDKWGFCDENGKILLTPVYDTVTFFSYHPVFEAAYPYKRKVAPVFQKPFAIVSKDSCYGLIDQTGKEMIPIEHGRPLGFRRLTDSIMVVDGAVKLKNGKYGPNFEALMDMNGNLLTGFDFTASFMDMTDYYKCKCTSNGDGGARRFGLYQFFKSFYHYEYVTKLPGVEGKVLRFSTNKGGRSSFQGFIDEKGKEILPAEYTWVTLFHNGIAIAANLSYEGEDFKREYFTIDATGKPLKKLDFDVIHWDMIEGLAKVATDSGRPYGLIGMMRKEVLPQIYDDIYGIRDGLIIVYSKQTNYSIFDTKGKLKLNFGKYFGFIPTQKGFYAKPKNGKWALYDQRCKVLKKIDADSLMYRYCHDVACNLNYVDFQKNSKWGLLNEDGKVILKPIYDEPFGYQLACPGDTHYKQFYVQRMRGKFGLLDTNFREILPFDYDKLEYMPIDKNIHDFYSWWGDSLSHSLFIVKGDGHVGVIDSSGNIIIPLVYKQISARFSSYSNNLHFGYYAKTDDGEVQLLDKKGNLTYSNKLGMYLDTCSSSNFIRQYSNSFYKEDGCTRQKGVDILGVYQGLCYRETAQLNDSLFVVYKLDTQGVAKPDGQMVVPMRYKKFEFLEKEQLLKVTFQKDDEYAYGLLDLKGNIILPCIYDMIETTDTPGLLYVDLKGCKGFASTKGVTYFKE